MAAIKQTNDDQKAPTEKLNERRWQLRTAIFGAAVALLGAAIGVIGSVIVANMTNNAFSDRTQRDFVHNQRATSFSQFNKDEATLSADELQFEIRIENPQDDGPTPQQVHAASTTLLADVHDIALVARSHVLVAANKVYEDHLGIFKPPHLRHMSGQRQYGLQLAA